MSLHNILPKGKPTGRVSTRMPTGQHIDCPYRNFPCEFPSCEKAFATANVLALHKKASHQGKVGRVINVSCLGGCLYRSLAKFPPVRSAPRNFSKFPSLLVTLSTITTCPASRVTVLLENVASIREECKTQQMLPGSPSFRGKLLPSVDHALGFSAFCNCSCIIIDGIYSF